MTETLRKLFFYEPLATEGLDERVCGCKHVAVIAIVARVATIGQTCQRCSYSLNVGQM